MGKDVFVAALAKKVRGIALSEIEINDFIKQVDANELHPAQIGAMLASMTIHGLSDEETLFLTKAFVNTGRKLTWQGIVVDKHSTGGVGDKISIPLAPALVACGLTVPMLSGRGLDFTGGTLDKLESIPGFKVSLSEEELKLCIQTCGCFIAGATDDICSGDKKLYEIRDVTGTVQCTGLIVASVLSKKISEGTKYLIQDIKVGKAALFPEVESAKILATKMSTVAKEMGLKIACVLTQMDSPIGNCVGNSLEVEESLDILKGKGPKDLIDLTTYLGGKLLMLCGKATSLERGEEMILEVLKNGSALNHFKKMIVCQGVDQSLARKLCHEDSSSVLPKAKDITNVLASKTGWIESIDAMILAKVCREHGAGRWIPGEKLDLSVGVKIRVNVGGHVEKNAPWMEFHHNKNLSPQQMSSLQAAVVIVDKRVSLNSRIILDVD